MTTDKIRVESVDDELKKVEYTVRIADPTVDTHPFTKSAVQPFRITQAYVETLSGTGTDTTTVTVKVNGSALANFTGLVSTASNGREMSSAFDSSSDNVAAGQVVELDITALGGTGHNYFDITIHGYLL